jgi:hypothetical protein
MPRTAYPGPASGAGGVALLGRAGVKRSQYRVATDGRDELKDGGEGGITRRIPAPRPFGAALRAFGIAPGDPRRTPYPPGGSKPPFTIFKQGTSKTGPLFEDGGEGGITPYIHVLHPPGRRCAAFGFAPGKWRRTFGSHDYEVAISLLRRKMAEREGFEPPEPFGSTVFKTAALNHSATSPLASDFSRRREKNKHFRRLIAAYPIAAYSLAGRRLRFAAFGRCSERADGLCALRCWCLFE